LEITHAGSPLRKVTISVGLAVFTAGEGKTSATWLEEADVALYQAKRLGRNRVVAGLALQPDAAF
jgi:diguanylate cyclase (GGDEF)-like protein